MLGGFGGLADGGFCGPGVLEVPGVSKNGSLALPKYGKRLGLKATPYRWQPQGEPKPSTLQGTLELQVILR